MDASVILSKLQDLTLAPWPLDNPESNSHSPWSWCPALQEATLTLRAEQGLIDQVFNNKTLDTLSLTVIDSRIPSQLLLRMPASSNLEDVSICNKTSSAAAQVQVVAFNKKDLQCCFHGVFHFLDSTPIVFS